MSGRNLKSLGTLSDHPLLRAADGLKMMIQAEGWTEGRRLPAEESLAADFGVSRSTLRKSLDVLEDEGWVRRERNRGCVVARNHRLADPLSSRTILVISDSPGDSTRSDNDDGSAAGIQHGMLSAAQERQYSLFFTNRSAFDERMKQWLTENNPVGLALLSWQYGATSAKEFSKEFRNYDVPMAAFGLEECPDAVEHFDRVVSDHESGMAQLLDLLASAGCSRILRLWTPPPSAPWIAAHERAFDRVAESLGIVRTPPVYINSLPKRQTGDYMVFEQRARVMAGYIAEYCRARKAPEAIMVGTDCETFAVAAACRMLGMEPGRDVLITGYDNYWHAAFEQGFESSLPFASVDKRNMELGAELIRMLSERVVEKNSTPPRLSLIEQTAVEINYRANDVMEKVETAGG